MLRRPGCAGSSPNESGPLQGMPSIPPQPDGGEEGLCAARACTLHAPLSPLVRERG